MQRCVGQIDLQALQRVLELAADVHGGFVWDAVGAGVKN